MQKQEIEIEIGPDGALQYTIKGVHGRRCEDLSALLEQLGHIIHEERTGDYYASDDETSITVGHNG